MKDNIPYNPFQAKQDKMDEYLEKISKVILTAIQGVKETVPDSNYQQFKKELIEDMGE